MKCGAQVGANSSEDVGPKKVNVGTLNAAAICIKLESPDISIIDFETTPIASTNEVLPTNETRLDDKTMEMRLSESDFSCGEPTITICKSYEEIISLIRLDK
ncbi:hypothetical protein PHIN7_03270 [Polynucleobacter sp. HIN7]|nr:hypothetical protein PHIN7_03270 [Polynucleobacter sp. HIN7]